MKRTFALLISFILISTIVTAVGSASKQVPVEQVPQHILDSQPTIQTGNIDNEQLAAQNAQVQENTVLDTQEEKTVPRVSKEEEPSLFTRLFTWLFGTN